MTDGQSAARLAYENAGREISTSFATQNSNMALGAGTLAAILSVLGAGELFSDANQDLGGLPRLSTTSLLVLSLSLPLVFRFFLRSLIAYQNLIRFNKLQLAAWRYLSDERAAPAFRKHHELYIEAWRSPMTFGQLVVANLKYGFFWLFFASVVALSWAFYCSTWQWGRVASLVLLGSAVLWEVVTLRRYVAKYICPASEEERCALRACWDKAKEKSVTA